MRHGYKVLREGVFHNPVILSTILDSKLKSIADSYLPFSVGFEIECSRAKNYATRIEQHESIFKAIPNIMDVSIDSSEQRFRIPNGIKGMICLWEICKNLKEVSLLNEGSGIHYHIDCSSWFPKSSYPYYDNSVIDHLYYDNSVIDHLLRKRNNGHYLNDIPGLEWVLNELEQWNYQGTYNERRITNGARMRSSWVNFGAHFPTAEFRIGEMTFEYDVIIKRMIHACSITRRCRDILMSPKRTKLDQAA